MDWTAAAADCLLSVALQRVVGGGRRVLSRIQSDHIDQNFVSWRQALSGALLQNASTACFFLFPRCLIRLLLQFKACQVVTVGPA